MTKSDANIKFAIIFAVVQSRGKTTDLICISGADPEISERGGRKPNSRQGGGGIRLFSAAFSHFLINLLQIFQQKGEPRPVRPLPKIRACIYTLSKHAVNAAITIFAS